MTMGTRRRLPKSVTEGFHLVHPKVGERVVHQAHALEEGRCAPEPDVVFRAENEMVGLALPDGAHGARA